MVASSSRYAIPIALWIACCSSTRPNDLSHRHLVPRDDLGRLVDPAFLEVGQFEDIEEVEDE